MVVSHLTRSHWRKVNSEETEKMKSYQVFVGGGTNLDLWVSALSIVDHNKESGGSPGGGPGGATTLARRTLRCGAGRLKSGN